MAVLKAENWDGVTAPAMPAGWNFDATFGTHTAAGGLTPTSAPNMLKFQTASNTTYWCTWGTPDGTSGNCVVSAYTGLFSASGQAFKGGVTGRGTAATLNDSSTSAYTAWLDWQHSACGVSIVASGVETVLAQFTVGSMPANWALLYFSINGTALTLAVQRYSDGYWLSPGGTWSPGIGHPSCIAIADATLPAASGYWGLFATQSGSGFTWYADDWELDSLSPPTVSPRVLVVYRPPPIYDGGCSLCTRT